MARIKDREKAIQLRLKGQSYNQIKATLKVSKSTLSVWLKDYPLSPEQIKQLRDWSPRRIENYRLTRQKNKNVRIKELEKREKINLLPLSKRDLFIAGLFLYWGEGTKASEARVCMSNTNPALIIFFLKWVNECLDVSLDKIKVYLHLYKDMCIEKEIIFWSKTLKIPKKQFTKPYIKSSSVKAINHKGTFGHGTCNVMIGSARLREKIMANLCIIEAKMFKN